MIPVLPYFVMMPGMGMGVAATRTAKPNMARMKSVLGHAIFGMFLTVCLLEAVA